MPVSIYATSPNEGKCMPISVFTRRSVAVATVVGIVVGAAFVILASELWELALPAGLAAGTLALVTPLQIRDGRFFPQGGRQVRSITALAFGGTFLLANVARTALGLDPFIAWVLCLVIVGMGSAAYSLGVVIAGALIQIEDDDATTGHTTLSIER